MSSDHWANVESALNRCQDYSEEQPAGVDDDKWSNVVGLTRAARDRFEEWIAQDRNRETREG